MKRLLEDGEAKEREERTNVALVVSVIAVLLVLTVGAEVIQASLLDDIVCQRFTGLFALLSS